MIDTVVHEETNSYPLQDQESVLIIKTRDHQSTEASNTKQINQAYKIARKIFTLTNDLASLVQKNARFTTLELQQFLVNFENEAAKLETIVRSLKKVKAFTAEQDNIPELLDLEKQDDGRRFPQINRDRQEKEARAEAERTNWPLTSYFWFFNEIVSSILDFQSNLRHHSFTQEQAIEAFILRTQKNELKFIELFGDENHPTNELSNQ